MENQEYAMTIAISNVEEALNVLSGGEVKRYHTLPTIGEQTVANHSWGVALILNWLKPDISKSTHTRCGRETNWRCSRTHKMEQ